MTRPLAVRGSVCGPGSVLDQVGHDQRQREEEQAEDEEQEEAMPFTARDAGGPERDCDPGQRRQRPPEHPAREKRKHDHLTFWVVYTRRSMIPDPPSMPPRRP